MGVFFEKIILVTLFKSIFDFSQQEFAIAAALSGDEKMQAAYRSGDPYLSFARQAGAVPCVFPIYGFSSAAL